jgi:hypothetical protein
MGRLKQEDLLHPEVRGQPGEHSETPFRKTPKKKMQLPSGGPHLEIASVVCSEVYLTRWVFWDPDLASPVDHCTAPLPLPETWRHPWHAVGALLVIAGRRDQQIGGS